MSTAPGRSPVLAVIGPTASGKTALALRVAGAGGVQVVSIDSATVYRGMDIGTAKPSATERAAVPHHLVDVAEVTDPFSVADFQSQGRAAITGVHADGQVPILVGGSGLYFRAVVDPLEFPGTDPTVRARLLQEAEQVGPGATFRRLQEADPGAAERIQPENTRRIVRALEVAEVTGRPFSSFRTAWERWESLYDLTAVGLRPDMAELDRTIDARVDGYLQAGWVEEVAALKQRCWPWSATAFQVLGYALILEHLEGGRSLEDVAEEIKRRTRRYARRQLRWFKTDPRINWFEDPDAAERYLFEKLGR